MQTVIQGDDIHMEELARMTAAMELLRKRINKGMPGQQMCLLLTVAVRPGVTMQELTQLLDMPQGSVSRNIKALSYYRERENGISQLKGRGLLYTAPVGDGSHSLAVHLTPLGEKVIGEIGQVLRKESAQEKQRCRQDYISPQILKAALS